MSRSVRLGWLTFGLALASGAGQWSACVAQTCAHGDLKTALLVTARRSRLELLFASAPALGRCADGFAPSTDPRADITRLARMAGLNLTDVGSGVIALTVPALHPAAPSSRNVHARPLARNRDPAELIVTARLDPTGPDRQFRSAPLINLISAEDMARRPSANIVEAVSILPGVSTYADMGLGQAATATPEFITVRGIDSTYNVYELNGARIPQSDSTSRALSLKMLPPFGVRSVEIVKSPTADYAGDSIGGVVDIRTPTGFDYGAPLTRLTVRGDLADLALARGFNGAGGAIQLDLARRFAGDRLGLYVTGYFQKTQSVSESGEVGAWVPTLESQSSATNYRDVSGLSAKEYKYDFYNNTITDFGGNASIDYSQDGQSVYLRLNASHYELQGVDSQASLRQQLANTGVNATGQALDFWGRPVGPGQAGNPAYAPQQVSFNPGGGAYDAAGLYDPNGVMAGRYFQLRDQIDELYTAKLGGASERGPLTLSYDGVYGFSRQARPDFVEASFYGLPLDTARLNIGWVNGYTPRFNFTPAQQAYLSDPTKVGLWKLQGLDSAASDSLYGAKADAKYQFASDPHDVLRAGVDFSRSDHSQYLHQFTSDGGNYTLLTSQGYATPYFAPAGPLASETAGQDIQGAFLGYPGVFRAFSRGVFDDTARQIAYKDQFAIDPLTGKKTYPNPGAYSLNDYNGGSADSVETLYAGYVSGELGLGSVTLIPGLRYEQTQLTAKVWTVDGPNGYFQPLREAYGEWLPSLNLVYRPRPDLVLRGSVRRSFSRPAIGLVASPVTVTRDPDGAILSITEGNPALKPTTAINYDVSADFYGARGLQLEAALYRKTFSRFIYAAAVTGAPPEANIVSTVNDGVIYNQPVNSGAAYLNGLELNATQKFVDLPQPLNGLGLTANTTIQRSAADNDRADHFGRQTWLPRAPELIYNIEAFYETSNVWANLSYQYTGLQLENLTSDNLDNFLQPTRFLNLSVGGAVAGFKLSVSAKNLTDGPVFWKTLGKSTRYLGVQDGGGNGSYVLTGRVFSIMATKTW